jgi:succinyl-diaminopimelate desuccinylase
MHPVKLSLEIISQKSVSGQPDSGAIAMLKKYLQPLGFTNIDLNFSGDGSYAVDNLYAFKKGAYYTNRTKNLCFAGHTDVVPAGDEANWSVKPYEPKIVECANGQVLIGRGAADMKCAIVCWLAAIAEFVSENPNHKTTLSFLITGDEEADSINGTIKVLKWLEQNAAPQNIPTLSHTIVGEPTNPETLGDMIKIGRRGSISFELVVHGVQGHVAYPDLAENPNRKLVSILNALNNYKFDEGNEFFLPTNLEVTSIDVGNKTSNLIPASASARMNVRFNNLHNSAQVRTQIEDICKKFSSNFELKQIGSIAESFLNKKTAFTDFVVKAIKDVTGKTPEISTTGGTSDARFIKDYSEVIEFGLINKTAHKVDENALVADIIKLKDIYKNIIVSFENGV